MDGPGILSIQDFLLAHVVGDDASGVRAEVARHRERTMTVVFRDRVEAFTRCGTCPREPSRPCTALRVLALPYAGNPGYRPEWQLPGLDDPEPTVHVPASVADLAARVQRAYEGSAGRTREQRAGGHVD